MTPIIDQIIFQGQIQFGLYDFFLCQFRPLCNAKRLPIS